MAQTSNSELKQPASADPRDVVANRQPTLRLAGDSDASVLVSPAAVLDPKLSSGSLAALGRRYDVLGEAGHGAMGNVYKARDRETGEIVALKLLKPEIASDEAMVARFKNELLFARKITHKNVCRVYEFNRVDGVAYTSMEFVEGESLRSVLNRFGGLPLRKAVGISLQICSGLKEAHAQGIVHRDLKPENVMIDSHGDVKVMDFGIARSMEAVTKLTGTMIGTPAYMAPEQVGGKAVDFRTDIYSLGLMLYEIFTGAQAFQAENAVAVALKQMRESPAPPHEVDPTIPVGIERAILKCIEKDPAKRFQSIAELEAALRLPATAPAAAAPSRANAAAAVSIGDAAAVPAVPRLAAPHAPKPHTERRGSSAWVWCLVGAAAVLVLLSVLRGMAIVRAVNQLQPPAEMGAPLPPAMAFVKSAPHKVLVAAASDTAADTKPATSVEKVKTDAADGNAVPAATTPALNMKASNAMTPSVTPPSSAVDASQTGAAPNAAGPITGGSTVPAEVRERANRAFKGFGQAAQAAKDGANYVWVGRYMYQDRAQSVAKKIEEAGLTTVVVPRSNLQGQFYVVLAGPLAPGKVSAVMDQLGALGFANTHPVKAPPAARGFAPGVNP